ncbi:biofilm development regulator YmgB/AriR family protein [Pantoea sp. MQR6]|uniref:biofilm development regulator YmgB/AriR family protein n=1 Tax=Pantoea sp. MQR6 TaxID=2907307 RepID=UPI001FAA5387|nr:biofilm development regulator YmgB/AriR family protein [Pantoea sp. MQR6]
MARVIYIVLTTSADKNKHWIASEKQQIIVENIVMQHSTIINNSSASLSDSGDRYSPETQLLNAIVERVEMANGHVSNKAIILFIIAELESSSDHVKQDLLRTLLERVVSKTPDDHGF